MTKSKESSGCGSGAESLSKCWKEADLNGFRRRIASYRVPNRPRTFRVLLWSFVINLALLGHLWPSLRSCFLKDVAHSSASALTLTLTSSTGLTNQSLYVGSPSLPPRKYKNNGYLLVSSNGGLNQMRAGICDMVAIARLLNLTLIVPMLDKTSFWADSSDFGDIFDVDHFIASLRDEVRIIKAVPKKYYERVRQGTVLSIPPVSWSNESYYLNQILPLAWKHGILHFSKTDSRLANNGLPLYIQKLRCRTNYHSLRFTSSIEVMGRKLVKMLMENGPFAALHLRYEMDMLAFSGCTHGCTEAQAEELAQLRYANVWWKEKDINSEQRRVDGLCPLTPEETSVVLKALGFSKEMTIYIAAGEIYGGERRMDALHTSFSNVLQKDMVLSPEDLKPFQNHSSQMAALDYLVAINSHVFLPTYHGNMAKVVEGHRRYLGFRKTIVLDRMRLVELLDQHKNGTLEWDELALAIRKAHKNRMGARARRVFIPDRPKEEDSFYANPTECLT